MDKQISVIIPIVRPESAVRCVESVKKYLPNAEIVTAVDTGRIGCPKMVERLLKDTFRQWVLFLGDDTELTDGFLSAIEKAAAELPDGWGVIGLNTEPKNFLAHWLAHKKMLALLPDGQFFHTSYRHCYCDNELKDIASDHGRWVRAPDAKVLHHHPINGSVANDEHYSRVYDNDRWKDDRQIYVLRKRARLNKLAIGFPLVDPHVPVPFFTSFACMDKPSEYILLVPQFPHGPWTGSIADARNSLVKQALMEGASKLLMLDTDQVYPSDTLTRLLSHNVDICGVRVHRRYPPFDPIFMRGELGRYKSVGEKEMYSGGLIDVDATGTGCLLFDMTVFDALPDPWFEFSIHEGKPVGEDIYFCSKARGAGLRICVDTAIEVGHLSTIQVNRWLHQVCKFVQLDTGD